MRTVSILLVLGAALPGCAEQRTRRLLTRLAEEAAVFERIAPNLVAEETLQQNALRADSGRLKHGQPAGPVWVSREISSEYAFAAAGNPPEIRELRKVTRVDGKTVDTGERAVQQLLAAIQVKDEKSRRKLLEDFEKHGLTGTVTDFGQIVLLFARRMQEAYAFEFAGERWMGGDACDIFTFRQQDGPGLLTVWDSTGKQQPRVAGEVWMSRDAYRPVRIRLNSVHNENGVAVREEADVEYVASGFGVIVPVSVLHKQYRDGAAVAENRFRYSGFREIGLAR